jgi:hypothetical protein
MVALRVYMDDSVDPNDPRHTFLTLAGYVATEENWNQFEDGRQEVLNKYDVPYFHMREFGDKCGLYREIKKDKDRELAFLADLIGTIQALDECVMTTVRLTHLAEFNAQHEKNLDPYSVAIYGCMIELLFLKEPEEDTDYCGQI